MAQRPEQSEPGSQLSALVDESRGDFRELILHVGFAPEKSEPSALRLFHDADLHAPDLRLVGAWTTDLRGEPAAVLAPKASGRQLSGRSLPKAPMTRLPPSSDATVVISPWPPISL